MSGGVAECGSGAWRAAAATGARPGNKRAGRDARQPQDGGWPGCHGNRCGAGRRRLGL